MDFISKFGLGSVDAFSKTGARTPTSAERDPCLTARREMWFGCKV